MTDRRPRPQVEPRLLSQQQAAAYCGVSVGMFKDRITIAPVALGRRRLYDREDLDRFIDSLKGGATRSGRQWLEALDAHAAKARSAVPR